MVNGAKIAVDEINAKGGVLGQPLELVIEDTKSNPTEAASVTEKLIVRDKVPVLMGASSSHRHLGDDAEAARIQGADAGGNLVFL